MNFIDKIRIRMHQHFLDKALKQAANNDHHSVDYQNARYIGILFDASRMEYREAVEAFAERLRKRGKKVQLLAYLNEAQKQVFFSFKHYSKKEVDFALRPKDPDAEKFLNEPFDILFNLYFGPAYSLEYISALSKASFRVGPNTENTYCYDLIIQTNKKNDLFHFIKQAEYFLNKMNQRYEANAI